MTSVNLVSRLSDGHAVAALRGELDISGSAGVASAIAALAAGGRVVIVDLSELGFLDCASLGAMLQVRALARRAGSDVWLAAPRPIVQRVLTLTGIGEVLTVHGSVDAAVTSIGLNSGRYGSHRPAVRTVCPERAGPLFSDSG